MKLALGNESNRMFTHAGMMRLIAIYETWLKENNVPFTLQEFDGYSEPHEIEMADEDALAFRLKFGL